MGFNLIGRKAVGGFIWLGAETSVVLLGTRNESSGSIKVAEFPDYLTDY
jgi:hypothetical protein